MSPQRDLPPSLIAAAHRLEALCSRAPRIVHGDVFLWRSWRLGTRRAFPWRLRDAWLLPPWRKQTTDRQCWKEPVAQACCTLHTSPAPVAYCMCGLYGYATAWDLVQREYAVTLGTTAPLPPVYGCFRAFGSGLRAQHGMRVQYGTPVLLLVDPRHARCAPLLEARYGCRVEVRSLADIMFRDASMRDPLTGGSALVPVNLDALTIPAAEAALEDLDWDAYLEGLRHGPDR